MARYGHGWGANYRPRLPGRAGPAGEAWSLRLSVGLNVLLLFIVLTAFMRSRAPHGEAGPGIADHAPAGASLEARVLAAEGALQRLQQRPGAAPARRWLTIGIPTVPRARPNTTYLTRTLESLLEELPLDGGDLWADQVLVLVMNSAVGARHEEFEALRSRAARDPGAFGRRARRYVRWLDNPGTVRDPAPDLPDPDDLNNPTDRPGRWVEKRKGGRCRGWIDESVQSWRWNSCPGFANCEMIYCPCPAAAGSPLLTHPPTHQLTPAF